MKKFTLYSIIVLFISLFSFNLETKAHAQQIGWCFDCATGDLTIWIEHNQGSGASTASASMDWELNVNGVITNFTNMAATTSVVGVAPGALPLCSSPITIFAGCGGAITSNWMGYTFPGLQLGVPISINAINGCCSTTAPGCGGLFPISAPVTCTVACATNAGVNDTSCTLTYNLNAILGSGTGLWTGPAGAVFAPANAPNATVTVPLAGVYTFVWTVTDSVACIADDTVDITFSEMSIPYTPTNPLCNNGSDGQIILAPQGGFTPYSYQWDAAAGNQITNPATNLGAGNYTVTVTDNFGCFLDSTFTLTEPAPFSYTTAIGNSNCGLPDGFVAVLGFAGGTPGYAYDWGAGPTPNDTLFNLNPNNYTIIVTDANGCDTTFTTTVGNNPAFTASITNFTDVTCNGFTDGTATADGSVPLATYNFQWDAAAGNQNTQTATNLPPGSYVVLVTDANSGCSDTTSITIGEPTVVQITTISLPINICNGESTTITATASGGSGSGYVYNWNNGIGPGQTPLVSPTNTTTYVVIAVDANNCLSLPDSVTVTVDPAPIVDFLADTFGLCETPQQAFTFTNTTTPIGGTIAWSFGDGNGATGNIVSHPYVGSGSYDITLNVTGINGCSSSLTKANYVRVFANPVADFTMNYSPASMFDPSIDFIDQSYNNIVSWNWDIGGLNTSIMQNPTYIFPADTGHYFIILRVIDANGCIDTTSNTAIILGEFGIYVPNTFTPDGDGINDGFYPTGFGITDRDYSFMIFDRWGERMFETNQRFVPWRGLYKGTPVPSGIYVWKLFFRDINGIEHTKVGHVNMIK